jgi:hypothetical protein
MTVGSDMADAPDGPTGRILEQLGPTPLSVDELVRQCQLSQAP